MTPPLPILPTTVIGSYSMPEWLERAKNEYLSRRLSKRDLDEMHDAVRKAAIKDQETAGIDIVSDGEAQRDNMIDYFTERMPGVQVDLGSKRFYYDFYDSIVRSKLATGTLGLSEEARFLGRFTRPQVEDLDLGPAHAGQAHPEQVLRHRRGVRARSRPRAQPRAEGTGAGRRHQSPDRRAVLLGLPRGSAVGDQGDQRDGGRRERATSRCTSATATATASRRSKGATSFSSRRFSTRRSTPCRWSSRAAVRTTFSSSKSSTCRSTVGIGVIDVKTNEVESAAFVADRIRRALEVIPAERLVITPDCGLVRLHRDVAFGKLCAMVEGTKAVRKELGR